MPPKQWLVFVDVGGGGGGNVLLLSLSFFSAKPKQDANDDKKSPLMVGPSVGVNCTP